MRSRLFLVATLSLLTALLALGQNRPHVTAVEPPTGKADSDVTVKGESLDKSTVTNVFLSDDSTDYKVALVEQSAEKIVMKIPKVKPGSYNVSIQVGNNILIEPVRFKVEE